MFIGRLVTMAQVLPSELGWYLIVKVKRFLDVTIK